jgi:hypothetical protein
MTNRLGNPLMASMRQSRSSPLHSIGLPSAYPGGSTAMLAAVNSQPEERSPLENLDPKLPFNLYYGPGDRSEELPMNPLKSNTSTPPDSQRMETSRWTKAARSHHRRRRNRAFSDDDFGEIIKGYSALVI